MIWRPSPRDLTFGGPPECASRSLCLLGLRDRYGLRFEEVVSLDAGGPATRQALRSGGVQVALMLSTDPAVTDYVELIDDRRLQPAENVTPLIHNTVIDRWGAAVVDVIDEVSEQLETATLRDLNGRDADVAGSSDVPAIAAAWLESRGAGVTTSERPAPLLDDAEAARSSRRRRDGRGAGDVPPGRLPRCRGASGRRGWAGSPGSLCSAPGSS